MSSAERIYISLGSNITPEEHIRTAIGDLQSRLDDFQCSRVYQSPAVGMEGAAFLNAVVGGTSSDSIKQIVGWLLEIEIAHGRVRTENKFTSRTLDLDLLLYGNNVLNAGTDSKMILPHMDVIEQAYVLQPLADIAEDLLHPLEGITVGELLAQQRSRHPDKYKVLNPITLNQDPQRTGQF